MLSLTVRVSSWKKWKFDTSRVVYRTFFRGLQGQNLYRSKTFGANQMQGAVDTVSTPPINFDFTDTETIFKTKKTSELIRALVVLSVSSVDAVADNSEKLMKLGNNLLGKHVFEALMRRTFYGQFVAGETKEDVHKAGERLKQAGIRTMHLVSLETDDPEAHVTDYKTCENKFDSNLEIALDAIKSTEKGEFTEIKISAFCSPQLLRILTEKLSPFKETAEKPESYTLDSISRGLVENFEGIILPDLDDGSNEHLRRSLRRLDKIGKCAEAQGIRVHFASEHTYLQAGISHMIMTMQYKYNRNKPVIFNTYQAYRKDTEARLDADLRLLDQAGVMCAAKIVRGAYMELERDRAARLGYEDPILPSAEATHKSYDNCVKRVMEDVVRGHAHFMLGTHNQESIIKAIQRMSELQISPGDGAVTFGQTYGMCDQVSFALGAAGYLTYKAIPYGSVQDTLLFLSRRARENRAVIAGSRKEKPVLKKEFLRRIKALQL